MITDRLRKILALPDLAADMSDECALTEARRRVLLEKPFLFRLYTEWYRMLLQGADGAVEGAAVELGSGAGFFRNIAPAVITSDILPVSTVDMVFSGHHLPFREKSISAIYLIDVLHHLSDPAAFLTESERVLRPGGRLVMIEPWNTFWGRLIWDKVHYEPFDAAADWQHEGDRPLADANGALPWIIFARDRQQFEERFPGLQIKAISLFMPFSFLISGGLSFRSLLPGAGYPLCRSVEKMLSPLNRYLGMFALIVVEARP